MDDPTSLLTSRPALIVAALVVGLFYLYRRSLPKPIPGIPYNEESANRILGDGPIMLELEASGKRQRDFWALLCQKHNSPIAQFFPGPVLKPIVVISDFREAQDLMIRRKDEIDRGWLTKTMWSGLSPTHFASLPVTDPTFLESKHLVRDIMGPKYIANVSTPAIYGNVMNLVEMWRYKASLAQGRPFKAIDDVDYLTADSIVETALGISGKNKNILRAFDRLKKVEFSKEVLADHNPDHVFPFPDFEHEGLLKTITVLSNVVGGFPTSPIHRLFWPLNNLRPSVRKINKERDAIINGYIDDAVARWEKEGQPKVMTNALQFIIMREQQAAQKAGRPPRYHTQLFRDALYGYCFAGQDTTHSALSFLVKYIGAFPPVQKRLHEDLRAAHPAAVAEKRVPTADEITKTTVPYLEAFMEEVLRLNTSAPAVIKETVADIPILGHVVPKGTTLLFTLWGASIDRPPIPVAEKVRSPSSQEHKDSVQGTWEGNEYDMTKFHPERWLRKDETTGQDVFNPKAGPLMTFSLGPRECWGKRLAYLQIRVLTTMLLWNFHFEPMTAANDNWDIHDIVNSKPKVCLVRPTPISY